MRHRVGPITESRSSGRGCRPPDTGRSTRRRGAGIGRWCWRAGRDRGLRSQISDAHLAVQATPGSSPSHPAAAAEGDKLVGLRRQPASAWKSHGVVHRRRNRGLGGCTTHDPRRPALVFAARDPDGARDTHRVPPGVPAGGGPAWFDRWPARPQPASAGPYHVEPT